LAEEIIAVSIGPDKSQETLRTALAMGADRGVHVRTDIETEPLAVAKIIKAVVEKEGPQLVLLGKQAIDDDCNQTAQMLSALLGWSQGTFASKLEITDGTAEVVREVDAGLEKISIKMPAAQYHESQEETDRPIYPRGSGRGCDATGKNPKGRGASQAQCWCHRR
jgi:electron transfer flavoprotein beta subunit